MKDLLDKASKAYYTGKPFLSDEEFDHLSEVYNYKAVGASVGDEGLYHFERMYSLKKIYSLEDAPIEVSGCVKTPKLDGAAVSLFYVEGELVQALTRGDGLKGRDITAKMAQLVPTSLPIDITFQVTGEVACPLWVENARNVASGALNLKSMEEFSDRVPKLSFIAYDSTSKAALYTLKLKELNDLGFSTVDEVDASKYPTDGIVYRLDNELAFARLGYTSTHPRGAFALKERKDGVRTKLLDVVWQLGKSGVVSPVAVLEPVEVDGATVARATLHNIDYIESLGLEIGCYVELIRSGEIIPRVVRRLDTPTEI